MDSPNLLKNMVSLGGLQVANFALSMALIPYLTRTLGVENWGRVAFVQLVINYLMWFCNWSFYLTATRKVAEFRADYSKLSEILITNWVAQFVLTAISMAGLVVLIIFVPFFSKEWLLYAIGLGLLLGNALCPFWFLNGIEKMREVALVQILSKVVSIPIVLLFVRASADVRIYLLINAVSAVAFGVITTVWIAKKYLLSFHLPAAQKIYAELKEGLELFLASLCANLNGSVVPMILGVVGGPIALGYYNLAERTRGAAITTMHPITSALFPRMCHLYSSDVDEATRLAIKTGWIVGVFAGIVSVGLYFFSTDIVLLLGGEKFTGADVALKWLAATPFLTAISSFGTHQIIIPAQRGKFYYVLTIKALVLTVALAIPAIYWKGAEGASIVVFVGELFFAASVYLYLVKNRFFFNRYQAEVVDSLK